MAHRVPRLGMWSSSQVIGFYQVFSAVPETYALDAPPKYTRLTSWMRVFGLDFLDALKVYPAG